MTKLQEEIIVNYSPNLHIDIHLSIMSMACELNYSSSNATF